MHTLTDREIELLTCEECQKFMTHAEGCSVAAVGLCVTPHQSTPKIADPL